MKTMMMTIINTVNNDDGNDDNDNGDDGNGDYDATKLMMTSFISRLVALFSALP